MTARVHSGVRPSVLRLLVVTRHPLKSQMGRHSGLCSPACARPLHQCPHSPRPCTAASPPPPPPVSDGQPGWPMEGGWELCWEHTVGGVGALTKSSPFELLGLPVPCHSPEGWPVGGSGAGRFPLPVDSGHVALPRGGSGSAYLQEIVGVSLPWKVSYVEDRCPKYRAWDPWAPCQAGLAPASRGSEEVLCWRCSCLHLFIRGFGFLA